MIDAVDATYHGQLGYAANHDHYDHANVTAAIWDHPAIDFIGIDSYFTDVITDYATSVGATSTQRNTAMDTNTGLPQVPGQTFIELMTAAWNLKLNNEILPFAAARKGGQGMPVEFTEIGYLPYNRTIAQPAETRVGQAVDTAEQIASFNGLINALDGRADVFEAMHIWQWWMPGSDGSLWNIDPTLPANQPNNVPLGQWLSGFVNTDVLPLAGDYNRDGIVDAGRLHDVARYARPIRRQLQRAPTAMATGSSMTATTTSGRRISAPRSAAVPSPRPASPSQPASVCCSSHSVARP